VLEPYDAARVDELVAMWRASFEDGVGIVDPHPIAEQKRHLVERVLPDHDVRVALLGDRLVGFVAANATSVSQLYLRVGFQRRGIGRAMLAWAKERSAGSLWLYTFARNRRACAFYESQGFAAVARGFEPMWQLEDVRYEWSEDAAPGERSR
jgi:ribosomal protein S18 acetylase RimI-like enzyme